MLHGTRTPCRNSFCHCLLYKEKRNKCPSIKSKISFVFYTKSSSVTLQKNSPPSVSFMHHHKKSVSIFVLASLFFFFGLVTLFVVQKCTWGVSISCRFRSRNDFLIFLMTHRGVFFYKVFARISILI